MDVKRWRYMKERDDKTVPNFYADMMNIQI